MLIRPAESADLDHVRAMFREYQSWLGEDLCFQSFEEELAGLPGRYAPPSGCLLIAEADGGIAGVVAFRDLGEGVCEMKRLFVRPGFKGRGIGRALAERLVAEACAQGYRAMRLDTIPHKMAAAVKLYEALGFREIAAYYHNPIDGARYMELGLTPVRA